MTRIWALIPLIVAAGCGGGDSTPSAAEKACNDLSAKASTCNLIVQCNSSEDPCTTSCQAKAACSEWGAPPTGNYLACIATCLGLTPDQIFACKDGKAVVDKRAVCDGHALCLDSSDEANCGASKDAGKD